MTGTFLDVDAPDTAWRAGSEDPIPVLLGRDKRTAFVYRFLTGRPLDGHARTDATFLHAGTKALTRSGHTAPYNYWPGWKRGLLMTRLPAFGLLPYTGVVAFTEWQDIADPWWLDPQGPALAWAPLVSFAGYKGVRYALDFRHERHYLKPIRQAAIATLRTRDSIRVDIPRGMVHGRDENARGRIYLPKTHAMPEGDRDNLLTVVRERLSHGALDANWNMEGTRPHMELYTPAQPPARVSWEEMMREWDPNTPHLGSSATGAVHWDPGESSPHIGVVGTTGSGKSELVAWIVAQFMRGGAGVAVLDPKGTSHRWLMNVPGVAYCGTPGTLTRAVMSLAAELDRRAQVNLDASADQDFPRLVVLLEERNSLQDTLRAWWKENAPTGRRGEQAPAIGALARLGAMGRSLNITLVMAGQETEARYIGSRSNYGAWAIAGRMGPQHWKTIMGTGGKKPAITSVPGRFGYVVGGQAVVFQGGYPALDTAKERRESARLQAFATGGEDRYDVSSLLQQDASAGMPSSEPVTPPERTEEMVTLRQYVMRNQDINLGWLRSRKDRDPGFPAPVGKGMQNADLYAYADLAAWIEREDGTDA